MRFLKKILHVKFDSKEEVISYLLSIEPSEHHHNVLTEWHCLSKIMHIILEYCHLKVKGKLEGLEF